MTDPLSKVFYVAEYSLCLNRPSMTHPLDTQTVKNFAQSSEFVCHIPNIGLSKCGLSHFLKSGNLGKIRFIAFFTTI